MPTGYYFCGNAENMGQIIEMHFYKLVMFFFRSACDFVASCKRAMGERSKESRVV